MYKKLFIPGPTHVRDEILQAQTKPMIGHRSKDYQELQGAVTPKLQKLLYTKQHVYLFASSGSGVMEGSLRQAVNKRALVTVLGDFSKRWYAIAVNNGIPADSLEVAKGEAITPELVDAAMQKADYDALTITMNETASGVLNPVKEIADLVHKKYPGTTILVDAVSAMAGTKIEFDAWGLDVCLASSQKCFALPPGLAVCAVSDAAREKALTVPDRGDYFAYSQMDRKYDESMTPATPAVSLIQALNVQLDYILDVEGLENRFARHAAMAKVVQDWAREYFGLYCADERYLSPTMTNVKNTRGISVANMNSELGKRGAMISNGYGDLKEKAFRIAHMGDLQMDDIRWLLSQINDIVGL